jgi:hypothetical protein
MHQVTLGMVRQVCIDPFTTWGFLIPQEWADAMGVGTALGVGLMAGLGGNVQLCWGANTQGVYGPSIGITHGPQVSVTKSPWPLTIVLASLVPALYVAYELVYGAVDSSSDSGANDAAKAWAIGLGVTAVALNAALLTSEMFDRKKQQAEDAASTAQETAKLIESVTKSVGLKNPDLIKAAAGVAIAHAGALEVAVKAETKAPLTKADKAGRVSYVEGMILDIASNITLISREMDVTATDPSTIYLNAAGNGSNGVAFVNASKSVTVTSGSAVVSLNNKGPENGEVDVHCGPQGTITITNMPLEQTANMIKLDQDTITLQAGPLVSMKLDPKQGITLKCGAQSIVMDLKSVTIDGIQMKMTAKVQKETNTLLEKIKATLSDKSATMAQHK